MAEKGIDLATLAKILGHSSIRMVERYVDRMAEHKKEQLCSATKRLRWRGPRPYRPRGSIEARFYRFSSTREARIMPGLKLGAGKRWNEREKF
jgi:hypothetical protein